MAQAPSHAAGVGKPRFEPKKAIVLGTCFAMWAIALGFGLRALLLYSYTPGTPATPPAQWPGGSSYRLANGRLSLLVFAHPQCPCSRATIGELAKILTCCAAEVETTVFFYKPRTAPGDWPESDLRRTASALPGVRVVDDPEAATARLFGAQVSGQVLLYDTGGHLAFSGGITALRGHSGDNDGRDAITAIARNRLPRYRTTPVFGCALYSTE